jgi:hypothetical protein
VLFELPQESHVAHRTFPRDLRRAGLGNRQQGDPDGAVMNGIERIEFLRCRSNPGDHALRDPAGRWHLPMPKKIYKALA